MRQTNRLQRGTTLIEILIVIVLSSLLIGLFLHADLTVNRSIVRWTGRSGFEQSVILVGRQINHDTFCCDSVRQTGATEFEVFQDNTAIARYSFRDSTITRNDRALLPPRVVLANFTFELLIFDRNALAPGLNQITASPRLLTLVLERSGVGAQTLTLPIRPYPTRHLD
jgi:competence protein ComGC